MARVTITADDFAATKRLAREVADALSDAGWSYHRIEATGTGPDRKVTIHIAGGPRHE